MELVVEQPTHPTCGPELWKLLARQAHEADVAYCRANFPVPAEASADMHTMTIEGVN